MTTLKTTNVERPVSNVQCPTSNLGSPLEKFMFKFPPLTGIHRVRNCSPFAATVFPLAIHLPVSHLTPHLPRPLHLSHHPRAHPCRRFASGQDPRNRMASDEDYMSFLDKTNQDLSDGQALAKRQEAQSNAVFKTTDAGTQVPKVIKEACEDAVYVTDADEPFKEVSLKWDGSGLPDESTRLPSNPPPFSPTPAGFLCYSNHCFLVYSRICQAHRALGRRVRRHQHHGSHGVGFTRPVHTGH